MKLYKARLSTEIVFVSEDGYNESKHTLQGYASQEIENYLDIDSVSEVLEVSDLPKDWRDSYPYGYQILPTNRTCKKLIPIFKNADKLKNIERLKRQKEELEKDIKKLEQELETL